MLFVTAIDVACSSAIAAIGAGGALVLREHPGTPAAIVARRLLDPAVSRLASLGVPANAVTIASLASALAAAALITLHLYGAAALALGASGLGDVLDGMLARSTRTASPAGALLDASADRYGEFFVLGAIAFDHRSAPVVLLLALLAIVGSFMVSYGSATAEALGVPVPPGAMRRPERVTCLLAGASLVPVAAKAVAWLGLPGVCAEAPIVTAVAVIAFGANVCAVRRLRSIASAKATVTS